LHHHILARWLLILHPFFCLLLLLLECERLSQLFASHLQLQLLLDAFFNVLGLDGCINLLEGLHVFLHVQTLAHYEAEEVRGSGKYVEVEAAVEKVNGEAEHHAKPNRQIEQRAQMHL